MSGSSEVFTINKSFVRYFAAASLVSAFGFGAFSYVKTLPIYSLYCLRESISSKDLDEFNRYFDADSVVSGLVEDAFKEASLEMATQTMPPPQNEWEKIGYEFGKNIAKYALEAMKPTIKTMAVNFVNENIKEKMFSADSQTYDNPDLSLESVNTKGKISVVTVRNPSNNTTFTFTMAQSQDKTWRIVSFDYESVKRVQGGNFRPLLQDLN